MPNCSIRLVYFMEGIIINLWRNYCIFFPIFTCLCPICIKIIGFHFLFLNGVSDLAVKFGRVSIKLRPIIKTRCNTVFQMLIRETLWTKEWKLREFDFFSKDQILLKSQHACLKFSKFSKIHVRTVTAVIGWMTVPLGCVVIAALITRL